MREVAPAEAVVAGKPGSTNTRQRRWTPVSALEFAGCDAIRMTLAEYEALGDDDKVEFFDSAAGLAWRAQEPVAWQHERPGSRLVTLVARIAMTRGSLIECVGAGELRLLNPESGQVRAIHPDQMVFLHPERGAAEIMSFLKVGEDAYPDVVLEVDNTRDTRRDKLALYEEWGFPELWVEVPNAWSPSRPRGLRPELRIYLLEGEQYVLSPESRAFVGWRAEEIHRALNEPVISEETSAVLERVGRALGERERTGPDRTTTLCSGPFGAGRMPKGALRDWTPGAPRDWRPGAPKDWRPGAPRDWWPGAPKDWRSAGRDWCARSWRRGAFGSRKDSRRRDTGARWCGPPTRPLPPLRMPR